MSLAPGRCLATRSIAAVAYAALRWLFYIEGALTMFVALIAGVMLPDRLDNSRWFSEDELLVAKLRMAEDVSRSGASVVISQRDDAGR